MLRKIKNWFFALAGVPILLKRIAELEHMNKEISTDLLVEKGKNSFEKNSTLQTKVRVARRRREIDYDEARKIINLLEAIPAPPRVNRFVAMKTGVKPVIKMERKGLSSTSR